ncbi:unnamed protein product [Protopolystoma xenopodis]|uniref:Uncharacterized protein n=1 Tax=Protopolystoma xenopodis TaxID=117903 RepID=A0A448XMD4_9PLAT|nr:unnamed protein product [Protopolystoma xenopodis]
MLAESDRYKPEETLASEVADQVAASRRIELKRADVSVSFSRQSVSDASWQDGLFLCSRDWTWTLWPNLVRLCRRDEARPIHISANLRVATETAADGIADDDDDDDDADVEEEMTEEGGLGQQGAGEERESKVDKEEELRKRREREWEEKKDWYRDWYRLMRSEDNTGSRN